MYSGFVLAAAGLRVNAGTDAETYTSQLFTTLLGDFQSSIITDERDVWWVPGLGGGPVGAAVQEGCEFTGRRKVVSAFLDHINTPAAPPPPATSLHRSSPTARPLPLPLSLCPLPPLAILPPPFLINHECNPPSRRFPDMSVLLLSLYAILMMIVFM